jgi:hypothetical protein
VVLRRAFGPKRDEVVWDSRSQYNKENYAKYFLGDQVKKSEIGGACSMYRGGEKCIQDFGGVGGGVGDHLESLGLEWRIVLKLIFKK